MRALLIAALVAACSKGDGKAGGGSAAKACDRYADMEIKCNPDANEGIRDTIVEYCAKARSGSADLLSQYLAIEVACAQTATECAPYKACVDDKKHTTPLK